eukprot:gene5467-3941_t
MCFWFCCCCSLSFLIMVGGDSLDREHSKEGIFSVNYFAMSSIEEIEKVVLLVEKSFKSWVRNDYERQNLTSNNLARLGKAKLDLCSFRGDYVSTLRQRIGTLEHTLVNQEADYQQRAETSHAFKIDFEDSGDTNEEIDAAEKGPCSARKSKSGKAQSKAWRWGQKNTTNSGPGRGCARTPYGVPRTCSCTARFPKKLWGDGMAFALPGTPFTGVEFDTAVEYDFQKCFCRVELYRCVFIAGLRGKPLKSLDPSAETIAARQLDEVRGDEAASSEGSDADMGDEDTPDTRDDLALLSEHLIKQYDADEAEEEDMSKTLFPQAVRGDDCWWIHGISASVWTVLLCHGGYFAGGVFSGGKCLVHKAFQRYVVRKKQGGKQSSAQKDGGSFGSIGSQIRAAQEVKWRIDVRDLLLEWKRFIDASSVILYAAPGPSNRSILVDFSLVPRGASDSKTAELPSPVSVKDPRVRKVPITTHRPSFAEVQRIYDEVNAVNIVYVEIYIYNFTRHVVHLIRNVVRHCVAPMLIIINFSPRISSFEVGAMSLFQRPHLAACEGCIEMGINFDVFRTIEGYAEWEAEVTKEIQEVYDETPERYACFTYSTSETPNIFASEINDHVFDMVKAFDEARRLVEVLQIELAESVAQNEATEAQRDPEKKLTRKERKQQAEEKAHIKDVKKRLAQAEYDITCLQLKLANVFKMVKVRVVYMQNQLALCTSDSYVVGMLGCLCESHEIATPPFIIIIIIIIGKEGVGGYSAFSLKQTVRQRYTRASISNPHFDVVFSWQPLHPRKGDVWSPICHWTLALYQQCKSWPAEFFNETFISLGQAAVEDSSKVDTLIDFTTELLEKHNTLPGNTAASKVLHLWGGNGLISSGVRLITKMLDGRSMVPQSEFEKCFEERTVTVALRLCVKSEEADAQCLVKRLMDVLPRDKYKRRMFSPLLERAMSEKSLTGGLELLELAEQRGIELWDADYNRLLSTIQSVLTGGKVNQESAAEYAERILSVMEQHHPVVGADNAKILASVLSGTPAAVSSAGVCERCKCHLTSFDLTVPQRQELMEDLVEKLIRPKLEGVFEKDKISSEEVERRWSEFDAFKKEVSDIDFDTVIDGANVGYYGLNSWYKQAKDELLRSQGIDPESVTLKVREEVPFPVDVSPKFSIIEDMRKKAVLHNKKPLIVLHDRHLQNATTGSNKDVLDQWRSIRAVVSSPPFLNDDFCWLYAALMKQNVFIISNDQMRDHHFSLLSPRCFTRWRQRHRITFTTLYHQATGSVMLNLKMPRPYSVWIQRAVAACYLGGKTHHWHIPYVNEVEILDQASNRVTSTASDVGLSKDGDDVCSSWMCTFYCPTVVVVAFLAIKIKRHFSFLFLFLSGAPVSAVKNSAVRDGGMHFGINSNFHNGHDASFLLLLVLVSF